MSSNRVRYTDEEALNGIVSKVCDKFKTIMENGDEMMIEGDTMDEKQTQRWVDDFKTKFETCLRLNVNYEGPDKQNKDGENVPNERLDYYNTVVYPQLNSMVIEVANKRQRYPSTIRQFLAAKYSAQKQLFEMKSSVDIGEDDEANEPIITSQLPTQISAETLSSFKVSDNLKNKVTNLIEAQKCFQRQLDIANTKVNK